MFLCIYHQRNNRYQQELEWKAVHRGRASTSKAFFFFVFLLLVVLLDHKNVGDELAVFALMSLSKQPELLGPMVVFSKLQEEGMSGWIQTRCAIKQVEGPMNTIGSRRWWTFSASTETRDDLLFKRAPTKGLCGGRLWSGLQITGGPVSFLSKYLIAKEREGHPDWFSHADIYNST